MSKQNDSILTAALLARDTRDQEAKGARALHVLSCARKYFGYDYASTLIPVGTNVLAIPNSDWDLSLGMCDNFFLRYRYLEDGDNRYCGWGITCLASLGDAYAAVVKSHGIK